MWGSGKTMVAFYLCFDCDQLKVLRPADGRPTEILVTSITKVERVAEL